MMKKIALLGLLLSAHVMDCSLMARIMPAIKLGALPALVALGGLCKATSVDAIVASSYADALAKYPFTTRLLMHRYRHVYNEYRQVKGEELRWDGFHSDTSPTGYRGMYRDYWGIRRIKTSSVILHTGDSDYLDAEIDGTKTTPKKVADKLTRIFNDAPKATNGLGKKMDRYTNCIRKAEIIACTSEGVPENLKRIVQAEYQKQTGDLQRDVWDDAHRPKEVRVYSLPAPAPAVGSQNLTY